MRRRTAYTRAPEEIGEAIRQAEIVGDFLPGPEQLLIKEDTVKVTLNLSKASVAFFKEKAKLNGVPYQNMIKAVLDLYTKRFQAAGNSKQA